MESHPKLAVVWRQADNFPKILFLILLHAALGRSQTYCAGNARSLTYAIDTTASMTNDIQQVCSHTQQISETLVNSPEHHIRSFILVPFNDPGYGPVRQFSTVQQLTDASCGLTVSDGGDCPEMSMSGLLLAIDATCPRSTVFLFTDAIASDHDKLDEVLEKLQQRQVRVVFVLSGNCHSENSVGYRVYATIAEQSGGIVFVVNKTEVSAILEFAARGFVGGPSGPLLYHRIDRSVWSTSFLVSANTQSLSVTISCAAGASPSVLISPPNNADTSNRLIRETTQNSILYSMVNPTRGRWWILVKSGSGCTLSVRSVSSLSQEFQYSFTMDPNTPPGSQDTSARPVAGQQMYIIVGTQPGTLVTHVNLVSNKRRIARIRRVAFRNDTYVVFGPFTVPERSFFLQFTGVQTPGRREFSQLSVTQITPQPHVITPSPDRVQVARRCDFIRLECITSRPGQPVIWRHNGSVMTSDGSRVRIAGSYREQLVIEPVQHSDAGTYTCQSIQSAGNMQSTSFLFRVEEPASGANLNAECNACQDIVCPGGTDAVWFHKKLNIVSDSNRRVFANGTLRLCLPLEQRQGSYQCTTSVGLWDISITIDGGVLNTTPPPPVTPSTTLPEPQTPGTACLAPPSVGNSRQSGNRGIAGRWRPGMTRRYTCLSGYQIVGKATIICQTNGAWETPPTCRRVDACPRVTEPDNGSVRYVVQPITVGSILTYSCNTGFTMTPNRRNRQCLDTGRWHGDAVSCTAACKRPALPAYVQIAMSGSGPGSTATYSCTGGRTLVGRRVARCAANGTWSSIPPTCVSSECSELVLPPNARLSTQLRTTGSQVEMTCVEGYEMSTGFPVLRRCVHRTSSDGSVGRDGPMWEDIAGDWDSFRCVSLCPELAVPTHGRLSTAERRSGTMVTLTCGVGHQLSVGGRVQRYCSGGRWHDSSGRWQDAKCRAIRCLPLGTLVNGNINVPSRSVGAEARYTCDEQHVLHPSAQQSVTRVCLPNGSWSGVSPQCRRRSCPLLTPPRNGRFTLSTGHTVGSRVEVECSTGYNVNPPSSARRECTGDGTWTEEQPTCEPEPIVQCRVPDLPRGQYRVVSDASGNRARPNFAGQALPYDRIDAECGGGNVLVRRSTLVCRADGQLQGVGAICRGVDCGTPPRIANSTVAYNSTTVSARATYECVDKCFRLSGTPAITCLPNGSWSSTTTVCTAIRDSSCTAPRIIFGMTSSSVFQSADGCLNLRCQVRQDGSSVLPARLHWYRDGVMVAGYGYHGDGADFPIPDMYRMTREGLKMCGGSPERSAGQYTCKASNRIGVAMRNYTLPKMSCMRMWLKEVKLSMTGGQGGDSVGETMPESCDSDTENLRTVVSAQAARIQELEDKVRELEAREINVANLHQHINTLTGNVTDCTAELKEMTVEQARTDTCCRRAAQAEEDRAAWEEAQRRMSQLISSFGA
ncbi:uncharacterized protein LOC135829803 isoform X2 [Sycon ciliatum]|uniref:uncharacterized protein LOC135829803 isoform X2 n=1 Tax=Sycon ciliatum TaxID=27933 RepID=UPI0031F6B31B